MGMEDKNELNLSMLSNKNTNINNNNLKNNNMNLNNTMNNNMNQNIQNKPISMDMLNPPSEDQKEDAFCDIYKFSETALNKNLNQKTMINLNNNPNTITSNQNYQSSILNEGPYDIIKN